MSGEVQNEAVVGAARDPVPKAVPVAEGGPEAAHQLPADRRREQGVREGHAGT